uniref:RdRp n=1 Tax=viral metagenome TaxID=1070528 RepID=A0A2V0RIF6_9ZZZZ
MEENPISSVTELETGGSVALHCARITQGLDRLLLKKRGARDRGQITPILVIAHKANDQHRGSAASRWLYSAASSLVRRTRLQVANRCFTCLVDTYTKPWESVLMEIERDIQTERGPTGKAEVFIFFNIEGEERDEAGFLPWQRYMNDFTASLNLRLGVEVADVPDEAVSAKLKKVRGLFTYLQGTISGGINDRHVREGADILKGTIQERAIGSNQSKMWRALCGQIAHLADHPRADGIIEDIADMWRADAEPVELSERVETPTFVRVGCPTVPPAVVTRLGLDCFIMRDPKFAEQNTGYVTPDMMEFLESEQDEDGTVKWFFKETDDYEREEIIFNLSKDEEPNEKAHLSHGSPWQFQIPRETTRHYPNTIVTEISQLWFHMQQMAAARKLTADAEADFYFDVGMRYMLMICGLCACEWMASNSKALLPKSQNPSLRAYLKGWAGGTKLKIAQWMYMLKEKGRTINYRSATDFGYNIKPTDDYFTMHEHEAMAQTRDTKTVDAAAAFVAQAEDQAPFAERIAKGLPPLLSPSCLTTTLPTRCSILLNCLVQHSNLHHYDRRVFNDVGIRPWEMIMRGIANYLIHFKPGKKLNKMFFQSAKFLLAAPMKIEVPLSIPNLRAPVERVKICESFDPYMQKMMQSTLEKPGASFDVLLEACVEKVRDAGDLIADGMRTVLNFYSRLPVTFWDSDRLKVLHFMFRPDHPGGYAFTNQGGLSAYGHASHVQKLHSKPPLDCSLQPASHEFQSSVLDRIMAKYMTLPSSKDDVLRGARQLQKGTSGGADKMLAKSNRAEVLGTTKATDADVTIPLNTNRKNVVLAAFSHLYMRKGPAGKVSDLILRSFDRAVKNTTGERSVPSRVLRIIYCVDNMSQFSQLTFVRAAKEFFKEHKVYSSEHKKSGQFVEDYKDEIQASLEVMEDGSCCMAYDAAALDQHIATGDRRVFIEAVQRAIRGGAKSAASAFEKEFGISEATFMIAWATKRLENYFAVRVNGGPAQAFLVDTQASGELLTAIINSIVSQAIVDFAEMVRMGLNRNPAVPGGGIPGGVWGDDIWRKYLAGEITPENVLDMLEAFEQAGRDCGQDYSFEKALSGMVVHFLQNGIKAGQQFSRCVALDHERRVEPGLSGLKSLLAKINKICARGGNYVTCQLLINSAICAASKITVFGMQFTYPTPTIFYPGGALNQIPIPFASENSKAYLSMNAHIFGFKGTMVPPPSPEDAGKVGERVVDKLSSEGAGVKAVIVGETVRVPNLKESLKQTWAATSEPERMANDSGMDMVHDRLGAASYREWNTNVFNRAVGTRCIQGPAQRWFMEQELIKLGMAPESRASGVTYAKMKRIKPRTHYRIGDKNLRYGWSGLRLRVRRTKSGPDLVSSLVFELVTEEDTILKTYKGRWHTFYSHLPSESLFLAFTGVGVGKYGSQKIAIGSSRDVLQPFSPSQFRPDLTAEAVVRILMEVKDVSRMKLLAGMGFTHEEQTAIMENFNGVGELRDIEEMDEYSSTPTPLKSALRDRFLDILSLPEVFKTDGDNSGFNITLPRGFGVQLQEGILHFFAELLYTESNITCNMETDILESLTRGKVVDLCSIPSFVLENIV